MTDQLIFQFRDQFELADRQSDARLRLDHFLEALDVLYEIRKDGLEEDRVHANALAEKYAVVALGWLPELSRMDESLWESYLGAIFFGLADELDKAILADPILRANWKHFGQLHPRSFNDLRRHYRAWRQ